MHRNVDLAREEGLFNLLDEDAAGADLAERARPDAVAGGGDRDEGDLVAGPPHDRCGELRLREREPRAARPDANEHSSFFRRWRDRSAAFASARARTPWAPARAAAGREGSA